MSLAVKDLTRSIDFYEALGFTVFHQMEDQGWVIMKNTNVIIGLFQGMFDENIMTFNPGWDENAQNLKEFIDIRDIQRALRDKGIEVHDAIDESTTGPANFSVIDPDGNKILFDQHV